MKKQTWLSELRSGDPVREEPTLDAASAARMRATVVAVAATASVERQAFVWPMALAALLTMVIGAGIIAVSSAATPTKRDAFAQPIAPEAVGVRQLQFAAPEGTRVFWTFQPEGNAR